MKTGNVSHAGLFLNQSKPVSDNKAADKRDADEATGDKVDLSTTGQSVASDPILSYGAAQDLIKGMDFHQAMDATRVSKEAASQLMELLNPVF